MIKKDFIKTLVKLLRSRIRSPDSTVFGLQIVSYKPVSSNCKLRSSLEQADVQNEWKVLVTAADQPFRLKVRQGI